MQIFTVLSYANSMVNPCLYAFTNENFRESFISAFRCVPDQIISGRRASQYTAAAAKASKLQPNRNVSSRINNNRIANVLRAFRKPSKTHTEYEFTEINTGESDLNNSANVKDDHLDVISTRCKDKLVK